MANGNRAAATSSPPLDGRCESCSTMVKVDQQMHGLQSSVKNDQSGHESSHPQRSKVSSALLTRQVSRDVFLDTLGGEKKTVSECRSSPIRCVSEFDRITSQSPKSDKINNSTSAKKGPPLPNPLHDSNMLEHHTMAVRMEAELHPMRLVLSRLMANLILNRKGLFNAPVDPVLLGLHDYFSVIKKPMDLGTVKKKLHSLEYHSRRECAEDIRLCFRNAMIYNSPNNTVHSAARELLMFFEDQLRSFCPELANAEIDFSEELPPHPTFESNLSSAVIALDNLIPTIQDQVDAMATPSSTGLASVATPSIAFPVGTRNCLQVESHVPATAAMIKHKRKKRGAKINKNHNCQWCNGKSCVICDQGCLSLEPPLLICNGPQCSGAKIRKSATYYIAPDGSCQFCQRCYTGLSALLPHVMKLEDEAGCRYKRDLLKRKNDGEIAESWLTCSSCRSAVHQICAFHNPYVHSEDNYECPICVAEKAAPSPYGVNFVESAATNAFTFITGRKIPVSMMEITGSKCLNKISAASLPETQLSSFIQEKVRERMVIAGIADAEKTVVVRVISDCDRLFKVPEVVRKHFSMSCRVAEGSESVPPPCVKYRSKAIALFQKIDGFDVCIFCMYVQEYDGQDDDIVNESGGNSVNQHKRIYIAYIDSVEYFHPRSCRTQVYHEILTAYLATARKRNFETAHIWACPPSRGNSFVFWNHPAAQRTPNIERLTAWYHGALSRAIDCGIVTDIKSLYESDFEESIRLIDCDTVSGGNYTLAKIPCPPLLEGDFWIEEALRVHCTTFDRFLHSKDLFSKSDHRLRFASTDEANDPCPALQIAAMLREKVIAQPSAAAFRHPVNAAVLNLKDYHTIISNPMDLGTVFSRCFLGEYRVLSELVADVDLVFSNAKKYNPTQHIVHQNAIEMAAAFEAALNHTTKTWAGPSQYSDKASTSWRDFANQSLSLNSRLKHLEGLEFMEKPMSIDTVAGNSSTESESLSSVQLYVTTPVNPFQDRANPEAVRLRMVGEDRWLLDKNCSTHKESKKVLKRAKNGADSLEDPSPKRRRQSWLGEEVAKAVRKMRTSFFRCSLSPVSTTMKNDVFDEYCKNFVPETKVSPQKSSRVADARHALFDFFQFRNFEFDTLRRAKYSSTMLLYHLHHDEAPGLIPECTSCHSKIEGVMWHRVVKAVNRGGVSQNVLVARKTGAASCNVPMDPEELCCSCHSRHTNPEKFIPLAVSFQQ